MHHFKTAKELGAIMFMPVLPIIQLFDWLSWATLKSCWLLMLSTIVKTEILRKEEMDRVLIVRQQPQQKEYSLWISKCLLTWMANLKYICRPYSWERRMSPSCLLSLRGEIKKIEWLFEKDTVVSWNKICDAVNDVVDVCHYIYLIFICATI